jgi:hypothetical protein
MGLHHHSDCLAQSNEHTGKSQMMMYHCSNTNVDKQKLMENVEWDPYLSCGLKRDKENGNNGVMNKS